MKTLYAFVVLVVIGILITLWAPWKTTVPQQDMTNELRWQAQKALDQEVIDSLTAKIHDDSVRDAGSTQRAKSRVVSLAKRVDSLQATPIPVDSSKDTTEMMTVHRQSTDQSWPIPKFMFDLVMEQQAALQKDTVSLNDKDQTIVDQRAMLLTQKARIFSADSVVEVRDKRIHELSKRRWQDYVAVGCGYGLRGADCLIGLRVPF